MQTIPRLIALLAVVIIAVLIGIALYRAVGGGGEDTPPTLEVTTPAEGAEVQGDSVTVRGTTEPDATVEINNEPVEVAEDGSFETSVPLTSEQTFIFIRASDEGGETVVERRVTQVAGVPNITDGQPGQPGTAPADREPLPQTGPGEWLLALAAAALGTLVYFWRRSRA